MTKDQIQVGKTYILKHTSGMIQVKVESTFKVWSGRTHFLCRNINTGRELHVKSPAKFKSEVI